MCSSEWPDWERVMYYVALIFRHFEGMTPTQSISPILPIPQTNPASNLSSPTFTSSPSSSSSSPSMCVSLRPSNSIPMTLTSALQTVWHNHSPVDGRIFERFLSLSFFVWHVCVCLVNAFLFWHILVIRVIFADDRSITIHTFIFSSSSSHFLLCFRWI